MKTSTAEQNPIIYCANNIVLANRAPWDFANRLWQTEIMNLWHPDVVIKKPTQVGITTTCIVRAVHFVDYYDGRVIFSFPRQKDITDYVQTVLKPVIDNSPYLQSIRKGVWQVYNHSIGNGFLSFMECSVEPRAIPADWIINDEVDKSDQDNLEKFRNRTDASKWKIHWMMSTPTIPGFGVDLAFQASDQREWMVKCQHCNHSQFLTWEGNLKTKDNTFVYYGCVRCHQLLPNDVIINGKWEAMSPGKGKPVGFHITQMMLPLLHTAPSLSRAFNKALSQKSFYNLNLGQAQHSASGGFTKELFNSHALCGDYYTGNPEPDTRYYMGIDQGDKLDVVILEWDGIALKPVLQKVIPFLEGKAFDEATKLYEEWRPVYTVVDRHPNAQSATAFRGGKRNISLSYYSDTIQTTYDKPDENGVFAIHKVEALDTIRRWIVDHKIRLPGIVDHPSPMAHNIIESFCTLKRDEEERLISGVRRLVAIYRKAPGRDDIANAFLYAFIAFLMTGHEKMKITTSQEKTIIMPRSPISNDDKKKSEFFLGSHPFTKQELKNIIELVRQGNSIMEVVSAMGKVLSADKILFMVSTRRRIDDGLFLHLCVKAHEEDIVNPQVVKQKEKRRSLIDYASTGKHDLENGGKKTWSVDRALTGSLRFTRSSRR